jgi:aminopeptidase-like protein
MTDERLREVMELVRELAPLSRTLVHPDNDKALRAFGARLRALKVEGYDSGKAVWTWKIPNQWQLMRASIEDAQSGELLWDGASHPLATVNYSLPVNGEFAPAELAPHLHSAAGRPAAIPFVYRFYSRDWGFCMPQAVKEKVLARRRLRARIETDERPGKLQVGVLELPGESEREFILCTNICHPGIANDSLSGAAAAVAIARHLMDRPKRRYTWRILWLPETIGSVAYFAHHEEVMRRAIGGLFIEMLGNQNTLCLQRTRAGDTYWDRVLAGALADSGLAHRAVPFLQSAANDEKVMDAPGVDIPTLSLTRYPYPEYHTSDDNAALIDAARMAEAIDVVCRFADRVESDYVPVYRSRGPVCLSEHGLYPDWYRDPSLKERWEGFVKIMYALDDRRSLEAYAVDLGLPLDVVRYWCDAFAEKGFVAKQPLKW